MEAFDLKDENFRRGFILELWVLKNYHNHVWVKENFFQEKNIEKKKKERDRFHASKKKKGKNTSKSKGI